ncbi:MAG: hypothetical protein ABIL58_23850 [Pseudomonadota bacterium]
MSHHHDHDHPHEHEHDHDHHHPASGDTLTFDQKMIKLVTHWIRHNDEHAANFRDWAKKAVDEGFSEVAAELETAARITADTSAAFKRALALLDPHAHE